MTAMSTVPVGLPRGRPLVAEDLEGMPDDGHRYELVDGTLIVSAAPSTVHQHALGELYLLLRAACPPHLRVFMAPFDVVPARDTVLQPDLLVCRKADLTYRDLPTAPVLALEILSPSTRLVDLTLKKARFEVAGCRSYWVVDPLEPRLTAWELRGGEYAEVADVRGEETWTTSTPFDLTLRPADWLDSD